MRSSVIKFLTMMSKLPSQILRGKHNFELFVRNEKWRGLNTWSALANSFNSKPDKKLSFSAKVRLTVLFYSFFL